MDTKPLIAAGKRMLTKPEELRRVTITEEDKTLNVALLAGHCGFPLKLELKLTEGSKELVRCFFYLEHKEIPIQFTENE